VGACLNSAWERFFPTEGHTETKEGKGSKKREDRRKEKKKLLVLEKAVNFMKGKRGFFPDSQWVAGEKGHTKEKGKTVGFQLKKESRDVPEE